jgi:hypothetical protein
MEHQASKNPWLLPQAHVMLAIRDGKWKPMVTRSGSKI